MALRLALCCLGPALLLAQEAQPVEPGLVPTGIVHVGELEVPPGDGDSDAALAAFLDAHRKHKAGDLDGALRGYLAFLGMPGRFQLPVRYRTTVQQRFVAMRKKIRQRYDAALDLYRRDRKKGVAELGVVAGRYRMLPEGRAARALWHSDKIREAIDRARELDKAGKKDTAKTDLERAVRRYGAALYRYEAKTLLIRLGGPDLFDPGERVGAEPDEEKAGAKKSGKKKDDDGGGIEVSDDDG